MTRLVMFEWELFQLDTGQTLSRQRSLLCICFWHLPGNVSIYFQFLWFYCGFITVIWSLHIGYYQKSNQLLLNSGSTVTSCSRLFRQNHTFATISLFRSVFSDVLRFLYNLAVNDVKTCIFCSLLRSLFSSPTPSTKC